MLGGIISLASYGLGTGGTAGNLLFQLEQQGVFAYVLPFLMIFAVLFGILTKIEIFGKNKGINVILSLAVALMALQMNFVSYFFREIFPRMGVMLSIILVVMVLLGLFFDFKKSVFVKWIMGIIVTVGVIIIIAQSFDVFGVFGGSTFGWNIGYIFQQYMGAILTGVIIIGGIIAITVGGKSQDDAKRKTRKKQGMNNFYNMMSDMTTED